jgi:hypothetical protein
VDLQKRSKLAHNKSAIKRRKKTSRYIKNLGFHMCPCRRAQRK